MEVLEQITQDTIEAVKKSSTAGITTQTGIYGVDLSGLTSLVPVNVPARNNTAAFPRKTSDDGALVAQWEALLNVNSTQTDAAVGFDYAGTLVNVEKQQCFAPYQVFAKGGTVSFDSIGISKGYADVLAVAELQTMMQLFIAQDTHIINSQNWALAAPSTPTMATATTGGSIAASTTVYVKVAARSGANYFITPSSGTSGNSVASADGTIETGSGTATNTVTATTSAVKAAVAYDWYIGTTNSNADLFYYTTTTVASCTFTSVPGAAQSAPSLPLLTGATPPANPSAADSSSSSNWYNGVIASSLGDYGTTGPVTPGSGTASGAQFLDNGGAALSASGQSITAIDNMFEQMWEAFQGSPSAMMMNSKQATELTNLVIGSGAAYTLLPVTDSQARANIAGGGFLKSYLNKAAGGVEVAIEVHPRVAPGTIIFRTDRVTFPGSNIGTAFQVRNLYDTLRYDYAANRTVGQANGGPRKDFDIRSMETLINAAPSCQGVLANVG